jgi:Family of unknown function (DUF6368)
LIQISTRVEGAKDNRELWIDGALVGCPTGEPPCTMLVYVRGPGPDAHGLELLWEDSPDEIAQLVAAIGFLPVQEIAIAAMCNRPIDHCLAGRLALHAARTYGGVIDLNGTLHPPRMAPYLMASGPTTLDGKLRAMRDFLGQFPGSVWEIWRTEDNPLDFPRHIVDADFMEAWLRHPAYHLIK